MKFPQFPPHTFMKMFLSALFLGAISSFAAEQPAEPVAALNDMLNQFSALTANVAETTTDENGEVVDASEHEITLQKPHLFRMHTLTPFEEIWVCDGETVWNYDPDLEQVVIRPLNEKLEQTPAVLLSGDIDNVKNNFDVSQLAEQTFKLVPKHSEQGVEWIEIHFNNGKLASIRSLDSLGQLKEFTFSQVQINPQLEPGTFHFQTPEGVEEVYADG